MSKMYMIQGFNSLYFVWSEMSASDLETKTKINETVTECPIEYLFSIRYGSQPLYEWTLKTDRRSGLPYIAEWVVDKNSLSLTTTSSQNVNTSYNSMRFSEGFSAQKSPIPSQKTTNQTKFLRSDLYVKS